MLFFHGGGYIFGHIDLFDGPVSRYVSASGVPFPGTPVNGAELCGGLLMWPVRALRTIAIVASEILQTRG
jgi:hypothetical protein